jgi:hypothetical protein
MAVSGAHRQRFAALCKVSERVSVLRFPFNQFILLLLLMTAQSQHSISIAGHSLKTAALDPIRWNLHLCSTLRLRPPRLFNIPIQ